jgi:hypothetical protein
MSFLYHLRPFHAAYVNLFASAQLSTWRPLFMKGASFRAKWYNFSHRTVLAAAIPIFIANVYLFFLATPKVLDEIMVPYIEMCLLWWALPAQGLLLISASLASHPGEISQINRTHTGINTYLVVWTGLVGLLWLYWLMDFVLSPLVCTLALLVYPLLVIHLEQAFTGIALDYMKMKDRGLREGLTWCFRLLLLALLLPAVEGLSLHLDWAHYVGSEFI